MDVVGEVGGGGIVELFGDDLLMVVYGGVLG